MVYKFNQSLHVGGKDFPRGNHEVSEKHEQDPHFLRYVGLGLIVDADKVSSVGTLKERNEKLHNRLVADADAKKAAKAAKSHGSKEEPKAEDSKESEAPKESESKSKDKDHGKHGKKQ